VEAVNKVAVVGAGTMGAGIGQVCALHGFDVTLVDVAADALTRARKSMEGSLSRMVKKGSLAAEVLPGFWEKVAFENELEKVSGADFVVEAVIENEEAKKGIFRTLDGLVRPGAVLASNTSSISITRLAAVTKRRELVIGMHFMNPVPLMELVEVILGHGTSVETHELTVEFCRRLGKTPVTVSDYPGFVSNRILLPMINEAVYVLMEGVASKEDIDAVMRLGMRHPMGPLTLADFIGLDVCIEILEVLHRGIGDPKYRPCPLLRRMVDAGDLGRKTGRGFYEY
jgi:3-hydroxybutyryl-CoA dehydrogenase